VADFPDQRQLWNAYGHAMGAAIGLELTMRIALINDAARNMAEAVPEQADRDEALANILALTFGRTVKKFKVAFPQFADDEQFCESIENAVSSRNHLAHHYLGGILLGLRSEEGVELATLHCIEARDHFRSLEDYLRAHCPVDYDAFFQIGEGRADEFVEGHPLRERLQAIKDGKAAAIES
jgi:hypothetical protein